MGAMFLFGFGGAWIALWAYSEFGARNGALAGVVLVTLALVWAAWRQYARHRAVLAALDATPEGQQRSKRFNLVNGGQWVAIIVVANVLTRLGQGRWVMPVIVAIVGLHFLPLAVVFDYRPHYVTGVMLVAWALFFSLTPVLGPASSLGALGTGVLLWASAGWSIVSVSGEPA